jgi:hypothetical protein
MQLIHTQIVLNPTKVGSSFLLLAHISVRLVPSVKKNNHQIEIPNIKPGTMMIALATQLKNSTVL